MKMLLTLIFLTLTTFGCANKQSPKGGQSIVTETHIETEAIFGQIAGYPAIADTNKFIVDLRQAFDLKVDESPYQQANEKITEYKKMKIYGSDDEYIFIEYDYGVGSGATFPWKYQLILTTDGKLVKSLSGHRFELVEIFENENPFLLTVVSTSKGNGGHELYKISADTLQNVYEGYFDHTVRTYDAHQDEWVFEPNELKFQVKDFNKDGFNDISFNGKIVLVQGQTKNGDWYDSELINGKTVTYSVDNPFKKVSVEFVFLYDNELGKFKAMEDYSIIDELKN